jgi:hypothetical protein
MGVRLERRHQINSVQYLVRVSMDDLIRNLSNSTINSNQDPNRRANEGQERSRGSQSLSRNTFDLTDLRGALPSRPVPGPVPVLDSA